MSAEVDQHLEEVLEKVKKGRVVLFLGAGASFGSGAPGADVDYWIRIGHAYVFARVVELR